MNVLLISSDIIDTQMAGPGIRYWEFAKYLSQNHEVVLLTPNSSSLSDPGFRIVQRRKHSLKASLQQADVVVTQGVLFPVTLLMLCDKPLVVDLYDPLPIELLEHHTHLPLQAAQLSQSYCVERTKLLLRRGDFFLYSHERQRDYWLGMLTGVGRVNHRQYREDPNYTQLLGCVPFGIADMPAKPTASVLRGDNALFNETDTVILWGGGLWKWFDPCSVIRAIHKISLTRQDVKLLFLGAKRAQSDTTGINIAYATEDAVALSQQLGLYNRIVFFHEDWVPYNERQNYFLEADIGISTHFDSLETHFSFRTRILDYLWTELPIITTTGDYLGEFVEQHHLGLIVPPADVPQITHAILRLADDQAFAEQCRENIRRIRQQFFWKTAIKPLEAYCASPYRTSQFTRFSQIYHLIKFYATTGRDLIQYRGFKKVVEKVIRTIQP